MASLFRRSSRESADQGQEPAVPCDHLDAVKIEPPTEVGGCEECLATGSAWVHLRVCMTCGRVGCCDSSPNRHASKHAAAEGHPIVRSAEPGEAWCWCFEDEAVFEL